MTNESKAEPAIAVTLDGTTYNLKYTFHSAIQFNRLTGGDLLKGGMDFRSAATIVALIWAGLLANHPEFDGTISVDSDLKREPDEKVKAALETIARAISFRQSAEVAGAVLKAMGVSVPEHKEGDAKEDKAGKK